MRASIAGFTIVLFAVSASSATVCEDPPCTADVLLFGSFNGSTANATTRQWTVAHDGSSSADFNATMFTGAVGGDQGGFAMAHTALLNFPTVFGCRGLVITARSLASYAGYTLSFGTGQYELSAGSDKYSTVSVGYKANFSAGESYADTYLSFNDFSRAWPSAGVPPTPDCDHDTDACPTFMQMQNLQILQVWAEGVAGSFSLSIQSIRASSCYQPDGQQ